MLWPREMPRPGHRRQWWRGCLELLIMLTVLLAIVFACLHVTQVWPPRATFTLPASLDCGLARRCVVRLPPCGPITQLESANTTLWYWGRQHPRNMVALLGFQPLLPSRIVGRASWDSAMFVDPDPAADIAPFLREVYARWPPDPSPVYSVDSAIAPLDQAVYVLDETTETPGPLTGIVTTVAYRVVEQRNVTFGAAAGVLYHLGIATSPPDAPSPEYPRHHPPVIATSLPNDQYDASELIWHAGQITLRMFAAHFDSYSVAPLAGPEPTIVVVAPEAGFPNEAADPSLLQMAATVPPYTRCG